MPKAEVGSLKHLSNQMKSKGLQRLRWFCQPCQRQMRDENAFKMHTQSESHVRQMLAVGEDPRRAIDDFSGQFQADFIRQLRTAHGEKPILATRFYNEFIADKLHVHMNSTRWSSLTEFTKHLGREGVCRVEETDKGLTIAWIDNSPEALRRQEALRRREAQDRGDEEWELRMLREQIRRAQRDKEARGGGAGTGTGAGEDGEGAEIEESEGRVLQRQEGERITLSFGAKPKKDDAEPSPPKDKAGDKPSEPKPELASGETTKTESTEGVEKARGNKDGKEGAPKPVALKFGTKPQSKNVFAQVKKNALTGGAKKPAKIEQPKKMSEAERIMREEMDRKRSRDAFSSGPNKKQRI